MDYKDIAKKTDKELRRMLAEERANLYDLRLKLSTNQLKDVSKVRSARKIIAQILMRLNELRQETASTKNA